MICAVISILKGMFEKFIIYEKLWKFLEISNVSLFSLLSARVSIALALLGRQQLNKLIYQSLRSQTGMLTSGYFGNNEQLASEHSIIIIIILQKLLVQY